MKSKLKNIIKLNSQQTQYWMIELKKKGQNNNQSQSKLTYQTQIRRPDNSIESKLKENYKV
jgi:hypothetical protein